MKMKIPYGLLGVALLAGASIPKISAADDWGPVLGAALFNPETRMELWIDTEPRDATGPAPLKIKFSPADMQERAGRLFEVSWTFGDGTSSTAEVVEHQYEKPGIYVVEMRAIDSQENRIKGLKRIIVTKTPNERPSARIKVEREYYRAGETVMVDGSESSDKDGTITSYRWTVRSASGPIQLETSDQPVLSFTMPQHVDLAGLEIKLRIADNRGAYSVASSEILSLEAVGVESSITAGFSPLEPVFSIKVNSGEAIEKYTIDYEGDGKNLESSAEGDAFSHRYEQEGEYTALVQVQTESGEIYQGSKKIEVLSRDTEMKKITARWGKMSEQLCKGDIKGALTHFHKIRKLDYQMIFSRMTPENIDGTFCREVIELSLLSMVDYYAQLLLVIRTDASGPMQFPLKMLREPNPDGDWYVLSLM